MCFLDSLAYAASSVQPLRPSSDQGQSQISGLVRKDRDEIAVDCGRVPRYMRSPRSDIPLGREEFGRGTLSALR